MDNDANSLRLLPILPILLSEPVELMLNAGLSWDTYKVNAENISKYDYDFIMALL